MRHTLLLSYFSADEVVRYKRLIEVLKRWPRPEAFDISCILSTVVTGIDEDPTLTAAMSELMPTTRYRCQTKVIGYPARPTAMFWELMEHVAAVDNGDGGFALWMEADMVPLRSTWLDELHREWARIKRPLIMGNRIPRTWMPTMGIYAPRHINGGACYANDYARSISDEAKQGVFDATPFEIRVTNGRRKDRSLVATELFDFGTLRSFDKNLDAEPAVVLHGWRQDKNEFYARWFARMTGTSVAPVNNDVKCCALYTRHLGLTYCPVHDRQTTGAQIVNFLSLATAVPRLAVRRRLRLLKERILG